MARTEYPIKEDPDILRPCSRGATCVWAGEEELTHPLPRTLEFFPKDSGMHDGMSVRCRKCLSADTMKSRDRRRARERGEGE